MSLASHNFIVRIRDHAFPMGNRFYFGGGSINTLILQYPEIAELTPG